MQEKHKKGGKPSFFKQRSNNFGPKSESSAENFSTGKDTLMLN